MDILKFVVHEVDKDEIVLARDLNGNWLHLEWCRLKYYEKKEGCPNNCDNSFIFDELYKAPYILVGAKCDFKKYLQDMRKQFDSWSERKIRIPYLWQRNIDKRLREKTENIIMKYEAMGIYGLNYMVRPEQHGIFVIATMIKLGYEIETKPKDIVWKINLIGKEDYNPRQKKLGEYK